MPEHKRRVAVVGSGMAGLVTAYLLQQRYDVTVYESGPQIALDAASVEHCSPRTGRVQRIDMPMRAFAGGFYSHLRAMYDYLGIQYHVQPFLFSFAKARRVTSMDVRSSSDDDRKGDGTTGEVYALGRPYFIHSSNNHRIPPLRPEGQPVLEHLRETVFLLACYLWFTICCFVFPPTTTTTTTNFSARSHHSDRGTHHADRDLGHNSERNHCESLDDYCRRIRLPLRFRDEYLLPLISTVATCTHAQLLEFPACDVVGYKCATTGQPHFVLNEGVGTVQRRLSVGIPVELRASVQKVEPHAQNGALVTIQRKIGEKSEYAQRYFDAVVLAVSPDVVSHIFAPLGADMAHIPTTRVKTALIQHSATHSKGDGAELRQPRATSSDTFAQMICINTSDDPGRRSEAVHFHDDDAAVITCPLNPVQATGRESSTFTRILRTVESRNIVNRFFCDSDVDQPEERSLSGSAWRNGDNNVYIAGGWAWDGMVLLEGCVVSAERVAFALGVDVPWS